MAKLTLSFKGHFISIHHLGEEPTSIGRDPGCHIVVDSLAVDQRHALISAHPDGYTIASVAPDHPTLLNNEQIKQAPLHHGDLIQIGKHTLHFSEAVQEVAVMPTAPEAAAEAIRLPPLPDLAYVQIQSGPRIGRIVALRDDGTPLTRTGSDQVFIARRGNDYVLACNELGGETDINVNGAPVSSGAEIPLSQAALIEIGALHYRFFRGDA